MFQCLELHIIEMLITFLEFTLHIHSHTLPLFLSASIALSYCYPSIFLTLQLCFIELLLFLPFLSNLIFLLTFCCCEIYSRSSFSAECCIAFIRDLFRATSCRCSSNTCLYLLFRSNSSCFLRIAILFYSSAYFSTSPSQSFSSLTPYADVCNSNSLYPPSILYKFLLLFMMNIF